ncbi:Zn-dependent protease with chaperone function [Rhizobium tibeticum]|uniref:M48 family metallopeptidase n=1 Tax=Rhizobium tibeticum TaxID=501024 RepID=UPI00278979C3|nr:M48 family metallopeptidase [Rhizobium tibeticum]MDP9808251.1 Zn-dependent protease with chaperone function [Rhizobium tibeticum]
MASDSEVIARGDWYPAHSSRSAAAALVPRTGELIAIGADGVALSVSVVSALSFSSRVGAIPRRIIFADGSVFETADNDAIDHYLRSSGHKSVSRAYRLEKLHPRILVFALLVILLGVGIYRYALPALVELAVLVTPPIVPELISSGALSTLDKTALAPTRLSEHRQKIIVERFERVASGAEGESYKLNFRVGGLIGPNAFALPDGNIVITDELVALAGGDDEMLAAVLAHEVGHVEGKHSLRQIYRAAGVAGLVMLIAGDVGSGVEDVLTQGGGLLALSYSRAADRRSVDLMRNAGMDPVALVRFFDALEEKLADHSRTSMLSTHPGTPDRKDAILKYRAGSD